MKCTQKLLIHKQKKDLIFFNTGLNTDLKKVEHTQKIVIPTQKKASKLGRPPNLSLALEQEQVHQVKPKHFNRSDLKIIFLCTVKYIFQNKTENDLHTYVSTVRLKMARRGDHVDMMSILTDFRSVGVGGDGVGSVGNQQQLDPAPGTENIQEERQAFDGVGVNVVGVQQQLDQASETENIQEERQAFDGVEVIGDGVSGVENQQPLHEASETENIQEESQVFDVDDPAIDNLVVASETGSIADVDVTESNADPDDYGGAVRVVCDCYNCRIAKDRPCKNKCNENCHQSKKKNGKPLTLKCIVNS